MSTENDLPGYHLGDIATEYSGNAETVINIIIDVTSLLTLITSILIIYLIFCKSPKVMSGYKRILLIDIILEMLGAIILYIGKPKVLLKFFIIFSVGLFPIQDKNVTIFTFVMWCNTMVWSATCLTLIQAERYYAIHKGITNIGCLGPKFFMYFYVTLNILITIGTVISGIFGDMFISGTVVSNHVTKITGGREFLQKYPGAVLLNNGRTIWIIIYYLCLVFAPIFIFTPLFIFLSLNVFSGFKAINSQSYSPITKRVHITLLRASILQVILLLISAVLPCNFALVGFVIEKTIIGMEEIQCIVNFYPLLNNIVIIFCIKPYRDFVCRYWKRNVISELSTVT